MRKNKKEITINDMYDTFDKVCSIYNDNYYIFLNFIYKVYMKEKYKKIHYFELGEDDKFNPKIFLTTDNIYYMYQEFNLNKTCRWVYSDEIYYDINKFGTQKEQEAYKILKELIILKTVFNVKYLDEVNTIELEINTISSDKEARYSEKGINKKIKKEIVDECIVIIDNLKLNKLKNKDKYVQINNIKDYNKLVNFVNTYYSKDKINIFSSNNTLLNKYKNKTLEEYDLSSVNFNGKNISGIDISKNLNVNINMDKIAKDLTNSNLKGYNLNKYTFRNFNLTNTNLCNTGATIDIGSCILSKEGKLGSGTLVDENNKFVFFDKLLKIDEVEKLGIKVLKKKV